MNELSAFLQSKNFAITPEFDGLCHRFDRAGKNTGWYFAHEYGSGGKQVYVVTFGDWKTGEEHTFVTDVALSPDERKKLKVFMEEQAQAAGLAKEEEQTRLAPIYEAEFNALTSVGTAPYLTRKQIALPPGCKTAPNEFGDPIVCVPMRDAGGKFWNYQRIYSQKLSAGDKFFAEGAKIEGCFFHWGELKDGLTFYIAEGLATAASIRAALPEQTVIAAFNAGNLLPVCAALSTRYPGSKLIVCADDDAYNTHKDGSPYNVGLQKGRQAAGSVGGELRYPVFKRPQKGLTDFNDLQCAEGVEMVKDQLTHPGKYRTGIEPMCLMSTKSGKLVEPTETQVTHALLKHYGPNIVKQERDLFHYTGTYWRNLSFTDLDMIKQQIGVLANGLFGSREIEAAFKHFMIHCPAVSHGVDLFAPRPVFANFRNCTLVFKRKQDHTYEIQRRAHAREDYITWVLPFDYDETLTEKNTEWEACLHRIWEGDSDFEGKRRLLAQIFGAALIPLFPQIALFWGKPKTGKSTLLKVLMRLVSKQNLCMVQPSDFEGFNLEGMVGKLVNIDPDINTQRPWNDEIAKKIIDRIPFRVRRKFMKDVQARIPSLHCFGCNDLPKTFDGASRAYDRRVVILRTDKFQPVGNYDKDFDAWVWEQGPGGIINFALEGLFDLARSRGHYHVPESSAVLVQEMQEQTDYVALFLRDVDDELILDGQTRVFRNKTGKMSTRNMWVAFKQWNESGNQKFPNFGRNRFFQSMQQKGYNKRKTAGDWYYDGFSDQPEVRAVC